MAKKQMLFKTKGMNQDLSVSAFNPEFAFENMNLRLSTNKGNTLMSWVNERGPKQLKFIDSYYWTKDGQTVYKDPQEEGWEKHDLGSITGTPIGTAVLNHQLVIFTTTYDVLSGQTDYIYKAEIIFKNDTPCIKLSILYKGLLGFSINNPIETLVSYESDEVQKVYWTDHLNQPRVINIKAEPRICSNTKTDTYYNFLPVLNTAPPISVSRESSGGMFAPGVIQYCYAYFNKYGQQTNIADVSTLLYISHKDRGAGPEEKVGCSFTIKLEGLDESFEYIRLYSIQRTSLDAVPIVRIIQDFKISDMDKENGPNGSNKIIRVLTYTDTGTYGTSMDPTELLFVGGKEITALTMTVKDGTLFLGNIEQKHTSIENIQEYINNYIKYIKDEKHSDTVNFDKTKEFNLDSQIGLYPYTNSLKYSLRKLTTFKGGETYRFGFQLQSDTGEWSDPIYLQDQTNNNYPTKDDNDDNTYCLPYASATFPLPPEAKEYKRIRPVIVFPSIGERSVICQGVINPTVFNVEDRLTSSPYSQASWFFRPYSRENGLDTLPGNQPPVYGLAKFTHYQSLYNFSDYRAANYPVSISATADIKSFSAACNIEIQGSKGIYNSVFDAPVSNPDSNTQFFVDQSIVTLNSPDIDFDEALQGYGIPDAKLRIVGYIPITSTASAHSITTSTNKVPTNMNIALENGFKFQDQDIPHEFGIGENNSINVDMPVDVGILNPEGTRMIAGNYWNDSFIYPSGDFHIDIVIHDNDRFKHYKDRYGDVEWLKFVTHATNVYGSFAHHVNFFIHPWQRKASLTNDDRGASDCGSMLKTKKISNILYSSNSLYFNEATSFENISTKLHLQENEQVYNIALPSQRENNKAVTYRPNIDKVLVNQEGYYPISESYSLDPDGTHNSYKELSQIQTDNMKVYDPIEMKYKSTSHAVIVLHPDDNTEGKIPIMPYGTYDDGSFTHIIGRYYDDESGTTYWGDTNMKFFHKSYDVDKYPFLWIGELYRDIDDNSRFGGKSKEALRNNKWLIGGDSVEIPSEGDVTLEWTEGDTYYQRYDCLKTYPFTFEDSNQMVEILSFMCETHVNIDGRYDNNRGQRNNVNMSPLNFNKLNPVYSQKNTFFTSQIVNSDRKTKDTNYPNLITFTKTKESGSDIDPWTNITLASNLEMDGDKGQITSLKRFNDQIIAFQDSAIAQVLYNENVQVASTQGVPIEIANSGKVDGKRYLTDSVGCSNKWSIVSTPKGIYFMDSNNKDIYLFNGQLNNLSSSLGFNTWAKNNIPANNISWNPNTFSNFVSCYDKMNQEVLFINNDKALAYSEKIGTFTSFYDYKHALFNNLDDIGIWIQGGSLWQHQEGDYCDFFSIKDKEGQYVYNGHKPYWMTLVGNPEPQMDKIFTNLEFRASVEGDGEYNEDTGKFTPTPPFGSLETWNEYQHGYTTLNNKSGHSQFTHHTADMKSSLKRKFRVWRCDIPRDNYYIKKPNEADYSTHEEYEDAMAQYNSSQEKFLEDERAKGIYRKKAHPNDRMRNPWLYLKLMKDDETNKKAEIHDVVMTYFG